MSANPVVDFVPDGATIEIGVGRIMSAVLGELKVRNDIGLHTGLFIDEMIDLIQLGSITNARKIRSTIMSFLSSITLGSSPITTLGDLASWT